MLTLTKRDSIILINSDEGVGFISPSSEHLLVIDLKTKQITTYPNETTTPIDPQELVELFSKIIHWIFLKKTSDHKLIRIKRSELQTIKEIL